MSKKIIGASFYDYDVTFGKITIVLVLSSIFKQIPSCLGLLLDWVSYLFASGNFHRHSEAVRYVIFGTVTRFFPLIDQPVWWWHNFDNNFLSATHYKVDLTPRKASIKLLIQEELTKLAEAEEDEDDEDDEDWEEDA